jgi:predicted flap endonuclease-1-like 5' DNA nuclease
MLHSENKQVPRFEIWAMAVGVAVVAAGVAYVVGEFSFTQAGFIGGVLAAVIVVAFGFAGSPRPLGPVQDDTAAVDAHAAVAEAAAPVVMAPVMAAPVMAETANVAAKPAGLAAARDGRADDLKIIKGIGPKLELLCHSLGFYHFDQVAHWTAGEVAWVDDNLEGFKGRVTRDRWVPQAKAIVEMGPEAFLRALDTGREF